MAGRVATATLRGRDEFGNQLDRGGESLTVLLTPAAHPDRRAHAVSVGWVDDRHDGTYDVHFEARTAGLHTLHLRHEVSGWCVFVCERN